MIANTFIDNAKVMSKGQVPFQRMFVKFSESLVEIALHLLLKMAMSDSSILLYMLCSYSRHRWQMKLKILD
mgnify:CR=1 FL=1